MKDNMLTITITSSVNRLASKFEFLTESKTIQLGVIYLLIRVKYLILISIFYIGNHLRKTFSRK